MPDQTGPTPDPFVNATLALSDDEFFALYGPWTPMRPEEIGEMLSGCPVGWHIAGGRAARAGAAATRHHDDTDVVVLARDLDAIRALHQIDGVTYLRPELALLFKARQDREKDREDLAAARLTPEGRQWLAATLERLGYTTWAELTRRSQ
jgi:hypothetical protein